MATHLTHAFRKAGMLSWINLPSSCPAEAGSHRTPHRPGHLLFNSPKGSSTAESADSMATTIASLQAQASLTQSTRRASRKVCVPVRAEQQQPAAVSRRAASLAALAAVAAFTNVAPAKALFGSEKRAEEEYQKRTGTIIKDILAAVELDRDAPNREEFLNTVRVESNDWVAKYRRDTSFSGRPSFGNTYSAVNAITGHINSFGYTQPVPKKRAERIVKELGDAEKLLARGR